MEGVGFSPSDLSERPEQHGNEPYAPHSTALELRADVASLDDLQHRRRQLVDPRWGGEYAKLRALHGPFGKWDAYRTQMLEACKVKAYDRLRAAAALVAAEEEEEEEPPTSRKKKAPAAPRAPKEPSEWRVKAEAHADPAYAEFLEQGKLDAVRYLVLDNMITDLSEQISSREAELYTYNSEAKLAGRRLAGTEEA